MVPELFIFIINGTYENLKFQPFSGDPQGGLPARFASNPSGFGSQTSSSTIGGDGEAKLWPEMGGRERERERL
jgi:hypothetical protein